jgi:hypothetical protein
VDPGSGDYSGALLPPRPPVCRRRGVLAETAPGLFDEPAPDGERPFGIDAFERGLRRRIEQVFSARPELDDHRQEHPWLLGCLGDPRGAVWFVAEIQVSASLPRVRGTTPELQWAVSVGDKLLRWMLVRQGFKPGARRPMVESCVGRPRIGRAPATVEVETTEVRRLTPQDRVAVFGLHDVKQAPSLSGRDG